jgi:hypothetical protein
VTETHQYFVQNFENYHVHTLAEPFWRTGVGAEQSSEQSAERSAERSASKLAALELLTACVKSGSSMMHDYVVRTDLGTRVLQLVQSDSPLLQVMLFRI